MTDKEFTKLVKDISLVLKKVVGESADSPNATELYKFLQKTHTNALTFDKTHATYKNYLELSMKTKKVKEAGCVKEKKAKESDVLVPCAGSKKKKADAPLDEEATKPTKKAKATQ